MSRGIVSQRPFSQKKNKHSIRKAFTRSGISLPEIKINQKIKDIISRGLLFIAIVVVGLAILIKLLFFKPEDTISTIKISDDTLATYQDIELFNMILDNVKGLNYYTLSRFYKEEILSKIQKEFPFVGKIEFQLEENDNSDDSPTVKNINIGIHLPDMLPINNFETKTAQFGFSKAQLKDKGGTLGVQIQYYEPSVAIKMNDVKYAVRDEKTFLPTQNNNLLTDGLFIIDTPMYLSGTMHIDGFFFELSLDKFLQIIPLAQEAFPGMQRFVYLAGSTRIVIFNDNKMIYFNFPEGKDIQQQRDIQINKYNLLQEKYSKFGKINTIDLGSLEENKVIIR